MRAFRLFGTGDVRLLDVEKPSPGPREVLVKVAAAGMCGSDLHSVEEAGRWGYPLPYTLGHETAGWVAALGEGASGVSVGEAVALYPLLSCGVCRSCLEGRCNQCRSRFPRSLGAGRDGGMAEFVVAPIENLIPIGDLDPISAAPLTDAGMTSYNATAVVKDRLEDGSICVVIGIGGLGHVLLQILRAITSARVIAVDTKDDRLAYARELGAWKTVRADEAAAERISQLCEGMRADVVIDLVGSKQSVDLACTVIAAGGKLVMVGLEDGVVPVKLGGALPPQVEVVVPLAGSTSDLRAVISLAKEGKVAVKTTTFPLHAAHDVLHRLEEGKVVGRAVLTPSG